MNILKNQTLYQCSYCGKRLLTKNGCKLHEELWCHSEDSPKAIMEREDMERRQDNCSHKDTEMVYDYSLPGSEDYEICLDCGMKI